MPNRISVSVTPRTAGPAARGVASAVGGAGAAAAGGAGTDATTGGTPARSSILAGAGSLTAT
jgi:hypothetical protein